ncbi:hypothetical protein SAMN04488570_0314 [Nocardioides scoriae]|uniref:50S ribosome-binding GTPase n=1 Tax=Nocardioides scoriae TaxID=642780 RepID=A0A1H1LS62_9ACTN|nr:ABC transporter [Nocardioides scoriae]SDR76619.1 hypothetical protein SAMN04488570_0314 [Nocardioides scoriae]
MSGVMEGARRLLRRGDRLEERVAGLGEAVEHGRGRLDDGLLDRAEAVTRRAGARLQLSGGHTVVALAGATGSGKSSTFNALVGLDIAATGVRRPTTSKAAACVWGEDPGSELLDWLEVPARHRVQRDSLLDDRTPRRGEPVLDGLVLLDLPDHDSTEVAHHLEVERLVGLTDLMVWVLDPQKYADAALHRRFLAPLASHREVMLVVLNHVDQVAPERREAVLDDVRRLLALDGLEGVPVLATSARTGEGIPELRAAVAGRVADKATARARLAGDVGDAATALQRESGDAEPRELRDRDRRELHDALADAAGVPVVVDAVARATTVRGRQATGWPVTSWLARFKPDPLRRLHLDRGTRGGDLVVAARSSLPAPGQVQHARVETTVRALGDQVGRDLAPPWQRAVRRASVSRFDDLDDRLDRVATTTDLGVGDLPLWCRGIRGLQWVLLLTALVGGVWLGVLAVFSYLRLPEPGTPEVQGFALPTLLLVGGVAAGLVVALLARVLVGIAARSRARKADKRLRAGVVEVADDLVVAPVRAELAAHRSVHDGLRAALR